MSAGDSKTTRGAAVRAATIFGLAAVGFGLSIHAGYPGFLNADSVNQLEQILTGNTGDWHPPFMVLVWSALLGVLPGPVGILALDNLLVWGSLAALTWRLSPRFGAKALLVLAVPLMPGAFNFAMHIHKDAMLVGWLLAASAFAFIGNGAAAAGRAGVLWRALADAALIAAFLTRTNVVFGLIPLLLYTHHRLGKRRNLLLCAALLALMPLAQKTQNALMDVRAEHPVDSIKTFQLLALSHFEGRNLFPGAWTQEQSSRIADECYTPLQWDTAAAWGKCGFIQRELVRQQLWGSDALTAAWLRAAASHPYGLYSALAATFRLSMREPNSRAMFYQAERTPLVDWRVETDPPRATTALARDYVESSFNDAAGRPWVFALLGALGIAVLLGSAAGRTREGRFALALLLSGQIYLLTYFFFNVSAEYRYFYWCGYAAYLGLVLTALAVAAARRVPNGPPLPRAAVRATIAVTALSLGLVAAPVRLPKHTQVVSVTPLDARPVALERLLPASTPSWLAERFNARVVALPGWTRDDSGYRSSPGAGTLVARVGTLAQSVEIGLQTGPESGRVEISIGDARRVVDTSAAVAGKIAVTLPPEEPDRAAARRVSPVMPARSAAWTLAAAAALAWIARRRTSPGRSFPGVAGIPSIR